MLRPASRLAALCLLLLAAPTASAQDDMEEILEGFEDEESEPATVRTVGTMPAL